MDVWHGFFRWNADHGASEYSWRGHADTLSRGHRRCDTEQAQMERDRRKTGSDPMGGEAFPWSRRPPLGAVTSGLERV